jgi:hypothetical protein
MDLLTLLSARKQSLCSPDVNCQEPQIHSRLEGNLRANSIAFYGDNLALKVEQINGE